MKVSVITAREAAGLVADGSTLCTVGMTLSGACESILTAIEQRFLDTGAPSGLTLLHAAGQCDRSRGIQHLAHKGLTKRIIGSHWGLAPKWMEMISGDEVEAYCLPQGQITHLYRAMACGNPGEISKVGLGTFVDPRVEGGKMNPRTRALPDISEILTIGGEEYMFYRAVPIDTVLIRGTSCDEAGNLETSDEAMALELLPAVLAARRYGGRVIAQVKRVVATGSLPPKSIRVPGAFIDAVVVCEDPETDHRQTSSWFYDPAYCGAARLPAAATEPLPLDIRKLIGRRACMELYKDCVINLGTGIPNDVIGSVIAEEGVGDDVLVTVESGIYGGVQAGGIDFGIGKNLLAMLEHDRQMDYYSGAGVGITYMGAGEVDAEANVNATKMGARCTGAGGFIDITQNAKHVVFCATFTTGGLQVAFEDGRLNIVREGSIRKFVEKVAQVSYNGPLARQNRQQMTIVTERAVFRLAPEGLVLCEIAPGIDLEKDVLAQMDFAPIVSEKLKLMPTGLFREGGFGLAEWMKQTEKEVEIC